MAKKQQEYGNDSIRQLKGADRVRKRPDNMIGAVLDITFQKTTQSDGSSAVEMQDPKLHCVISQYEDGWKNIREYPYSAYTDELGAAHGNFTLTREYIESVLYGSIDEQFVALD